MYRKAYLKQVLPNSYWKIDQSRLTSCASCIVSEFIAKTC